MANPGDIAAVIDGLEGVGRLSPAQLAVLEAAVSRQLDAPGGPDVASLRRAIEAVGIDAFIRDNSALLDTPEVQSRLSDVGKAPPASGSGDLSVPAAGEETGGEDPTTEFVLTAIENGYGFLRDDGLVQVVTPDGVFLFDEQENGSFLLLSQDPAKAGTGPVQFASERERDLAAAALDLAQTERIQFELDNLRRLSNGEINIVPVEGVPGLFIDLNTGQTIDRAQLYESIRQFDITDERQRAEFDRTETRLDKALEQEQSRFLQQLAFQREQAAAEEARSRRQEDIQLRGLGLEASIAEQQAALQEAELTSRILREPADFLARAFALRGQTSPNTPITQADLINQARSSTDALRRSFADLVAPLSSGTGEPSLAQSPLAQLLSSPVPGLEQGGSAQGRLLLVGEAGPELIMNPANAPLQVVPVDQTQQGAKGEQRGIPGAQGGGNFGALGPVTSSGPGQLSGQLFGFSGPPGSEQDFLDNPDSFFAFLDSIFNDVRTQNPLLFALRQLLTQQQRPPLTQAEIVAEARRTTPPGPAAVLAGRQPQPLQAPEGLTLPTSRLLASLNQAEQEALNTRLAAEFNVSLADITDIAQRRSGPTGSRMARFI